MPPTPDPRLREAFLRWGYLQADLDPLGRIPPLPHPALEAGGAGADALRSVYCGPLAVEVAHLVDPARVEWIASRMEASPDAVDLGTVLRQVAEAELFERFLHARYPGTRRYSVEGIAALVPLLDAVLDESAAHGVDTALLGMSHRGRLAVMLTILGVPPLALLAGFEDVDPRSQLGGGDVKFHLGATGAHRTPAEGQIAVHLVSNPSHLEAVDPVLTGRARARQTRRGGEGRRRVLPLLLHGDGAFAGQGIAAETLNLAELPGFDVGGTIHVVLDNRVAFTTRPGALHSSRFASDVAKRLQVPILHVNSEHPEAVVRAARLAAAYRMALGSDVVVNLIGYRRYGHSEVDDPSTTEPLVYRRIAERPMLCEQIAATVPGGEAALAALRADLQARLETAQAQSRALTERPPLRALPSWWSGFRGGAHDPSDEVDTAVPEARLREVGEALARLPPGFRPHPKVEELLHRRRDMARGERPVDWAGAEALALATLARQGVPVRLAGQDARRGTFNQRHAVVVDVETGDEHLPLAAVHPEQAWVEVRDTALAEAAPLGFEYGFSRDYPEALVAWEAQFGDFVNGAQVILDQFIAAGEDKWGLLSGLVLLLPHGYEGQGPEHSSARLERFLQLAAENNLQVCVPSTAGQYFHLLRRQALRRWRKPLVVLTPKGLLRARPATVPLAALASGRFEPVLADPAPPAAATRVLLCSGKLGHELVAERDRRAAAAAVAVLRLEQLYPFPEAELRAAIAAHAGAQRVLWVQEEPANMGALAFVLPRLERVLGHRVASVKRSESASPATGSAAAHALEQRALIDAALA